ncbi:hypothetical protein IVB30_01890 [Bradyrhizobium sp. 200]|uniref:hypothetical protein n=1 Tax=Bradyrhizobium sp. 200 TaxID=2782665 RepID=UPI001FFF3CC2|nr:hypothetical protein [Bradyrhizobium sp. 200]UPJ50210.1 hypothetical protein IVB30_01890 [Bradyrhizobium sp. 200]
MVGFPLLLIPLAIYNIIVFLMPSVSFTDPLVKLTLMSGAEWTVTLSDVLLALAILLLLAEVIKGARPGAKYLTDHLLSLIVFGAAAAEFMLWPKFGTSTYFLLTALALVDFLSGLALRTRRRAVAVAAAPAPAPAPPPKAAEPPPKAPEKVEAPAAEPQIEPAPPAAAPAPAAPSVPPAATVAESVLKDHPEPKPVQPAVASEAVSPKTPSPEVHSPDVSAPETSSPEVPSPGLQPGPGFPPPPDKPDTPQR